jgi:hypothetical protein
MLLARPRSLSAAGGVIENRAHVAVDKQPDDDAFGLQEHAINCQHRLAVPQEKSAQLRLNRSPRRVHNAPMQHGIEYTAGIYLREEDFVNHWMGSVEAALP